MLLCMHAFFVLIIYKLTTVAGISDVIQHRHIFYARWNQSLWNHAYMIINILHQNLRIYVNMIDNFLYQNIIHIRAPGSIPGLGKKKCISLHS